MPTSSFVSVAQLVLAISVIRLPIDNTNYKCVCINFVYQLGVCECEHVVKYQQTHDIVTVTVATT